MLGLQLRKEFQGKRLKGTQIELRNSKKTGAVQQPAEEFLEITYPSSDVIKSLRALGHEQARPVVLMGSRGRGKSHLMAVLHHALTSHTATVKWLETWGQRLGDPGLGQIPLPEGLHVISESLHEGNYKFLWDIVFDKHPRGDFFKGKWSEKKQRAATPSKDLLIQMFEDCPTALLLDEYQTWHDGQIEEPSRPHRTWAFTFIQLLSEIASERPKCLRLVVSVRDGNSDAYQQIHRVSPLQVTFSGPSARQDRLRLLLHRLFQNRLQISDGDIDKLLQAHVGQYLQLFDVNADEHQARRQSFREAWPFSPQLMELLEDQVLVATDTQETRDLLVILAGLFKSRGEETPLITAADFDLVSESDEVTAHIESVASEHHRRLREVARRNLTAVQGAFPHWKVELPLLEGVLTSLWLRSLAVGNSGGAEPRALQLDVTRRDVLDANKFAAQLEQIVENSFNIHQHGNRLIFRDEENPQARLLAEARNDRLFTDGSDYLELAKQIRYALAGGDEMSRDFVLVVLGRGWQSSPWSGAGEASKPETWGERIPLIVLPENPRDLGAALGAWLKTHVLLGRNRVRFIMPRADLPNLQADRELIYKARAALKAGEWKNSNSVYRDLHKRYTSELQNILKERFERFAILEIWNYQQPELSQFRSEKLTAQGSKIPAAIEDAVRQDLFEPEGFEELVLQLAQQNQTVAKLLAELREPRPNGQPCIPWLGEVQLKEKLVRVCAAGKISLNLREMETLQRKPGESIDEAWTRMKGKLGSGRDLETTRILLPQAQATSQSVVPTGLGGATLVQQDSGNGYTPQTTGPPTSPFAPSPVATTAAKLQQAPTTSPLNLLGRLESWGIGPATRVRRVRLEMDMDSASGSQIADLLKKLPDGLRCSLQLESEE